MFNLSKEVSNSVVHCFNFIPKVSLEEVKEISDSKFSWIIGEYNEKVKDEYKVDYTLTSDKFDFIDSDDEDIWWFYWEKTKKIIKNKIMSINMIKVRDSYKYAYKKYSWVYWIQNIFSYNKEFFELKEWNRYSLHDVNLNYEEFKNKYDYVIVRNNTRYSEVNKEENWRISYLYEYDEVFYNWESYYIIFSEYENEYVLSKFEWNINWDISFEPHFLLREVYKNCLNSEDKELLIIWDFIENEILKNNVEID